jgi:hypothetical protein
MKKITKNLALGAVTAMFVSLGLGAGAALAGVPTLFSPAGVTSHTQTAPMPAPSYDLNDSGQSYGSAAQATSPANEPDLIAAQTTDGKEGYVRKSDLDRASGATAAKSFKTPAEALAWQAAEGRIDHPIPVYEKDGKTVIGMFVVSGGETQQKIAANLESTGK